LEETDLWIGDFWRSVDFSNTDFSLVEIIGENGFPMEGRTEKQRKPVKAKTHDLGQGQIKLENSGATWKSGWKSG